jgi:hypothetical protein
MSTDDVRREFEGQVNGALNGGPGPLMAGEFSPPYMPALVRDYLALVGPTTSAARVFHYASFMTVAALALGPLINVGGNPRSRPNLFTLLAGPSRFSHKSTAMEYALDVLTRTGLAFYLLRGMVSIEGMEKLIKHKDQPRILPFEDELANLLAVQERGSTSNIIPRLCELHGLKDTFELNGLDAGVLTKPFTCFLAGVTPEFLQGKEARAAGRLGFFNRCWVVYGAAHKPLDDWHWPNEGGLIAVAQGLRDLLDELKERPVSFSYSSAARERRKAWLSEWYESAVSRANKGELFNPETNNLLPRFETLAAALDRAGEIGPQHTEHAIAVLTATEADALRVMTIRAANRDRDAEEWCEEHIPIGRTAMRHIQMAAHKVVAMADVWKVLRTWENLGRAKVLDSQGKRGPQGKDVARYW